MILVDANLLVYAHVTSLSQHHAARDWFDSCLNGPTPVGVTMAHIAQLRAPGVKPTYL